MRCKISVKVWTQDSHEPVDTLLDGESTNDSYTDLNNNITHIGVTYQKPTWVTRKGWLGISYQSLEDRPVTEMIPIDKVFFLKNMPVQLQIMDTKGLQYYDAMRRAAELDRGAGVIVPAALLKTWGDLSEIAEKSLKYTSEQFESVPKGEVVITTNEKGRAVAVTRQDSEGRILSVIWNYVKKKDRKKEQNKVEG